MVDFTGVIIEESLKDKSILKRLKIIKTEIEKTTVEHKSHVAQWTMDTISVPEKHASKIAKEISAALDPDHGWYADFKNDGYHYIIFHGKVFYVDRKSKSQYERATAYGISLGIPNYQLEFSPEIK